MVQKSRRPCRSTVMAPIINSFPLFPLLPTELRLKIWGHASPLPRIIELSWPPEEHSKARSPISKTAPPSVIQACRESRYEFIGHYDELEFRDSPQVILVNYSQDTVFFGPGCKHLLPSGKTSRWIQVNRKLMKDIIFSSSLIQNLKVAAFDCGFLLALDDQGAASMEGLYGSMKKLEEVIISRTEDWENARVECRRLKAIGMKFIQATGDTRSMPYQEATLAHDFSVRQRRHSNVKKIQIADVELLARPVEKLPPPSSSPLRHNFSIRHQITFLKHRKLLRVRSRASSKTPHQPPSYSELSK